MWSQDRVGGREADRDYTDLNTDQIQIMHGAVSVHVTRDWHGKTAHSDGRQWLPASRWGWRVLSVREAFLFPVRIGTVLLVTQRWVHLQIEWFKWQASCTGQNTFSEPFARTRIYLWFHVPDVGHRGSQEFPAWCWTLPSASRNCNRQRGAPTDGCPSLSANNFQPPEYFK